METFKASTQYGDWEGTASADEQQNSIRELLKDKGIMKDHEFLIAATLYVSEGSYNEPFIRVFLYTKRSDFESVKHAIAATKGPIPVRSAEVPLTVEEFLNLFKRFDVTLTWHGLDLNGRDFIAA